jgi:hypothetical protein
MSEETVAVVKSTFDNLIVGDYPKFFSENAGIIVNGKPTCLMQFSGLAVDKFGNKDYYPFRIWGDKARVYSQRIKPGAKFKCEAVPRSASVPVSGKSGKPLQLPNGETRKTWKVYFSVVNLDIL